MPSYQYTAVDPQGKNQKGLIEAENAKQARDQLRARHYLPIELHEADLKNKPTLASGWKTRVSVSEVALFTRQLATLLSSGIPLDEALTSITEQAESKPLRSMLSTIREKILEGYSLADALNEFPRSFSAIYRATVGAGEKTGRLDKILERLAEFTEQQYMVRRKLFQAAIYPALIILASIGIVSFLLAFVVPKMIAVFQENNSVLPISTRILIQISDFISQDGVYALALMIVLAIVFQRMLKRENIKIRFHRFLLSLPLIGRNIKLINTARFSHTLSILSNAGVEIIGAMQIASQTLANLPIRHSLEQATREVREGVPIHRALKKTGYFPPMSLHLIASGENSGHLTQMLARTAQTQEEAVQATINLTLTLFEPFIILVMGAVVLFIVLAILLPVFDLNQLVQQ